MKFSVIIPLYNKEKHIKRAITSILNQTYQNFEIIVVDDGSTDSSVEKVKELSDLRIKLIKQKNQGVSSARNTGINNANFDYLGFLDADDSWESDFLESISRLIQNNPNAGAYATSYEIISSDGRVVSPKFNIDINIGETVVVDYFKSALKYPIISASSVVVPKHVFDKIGIFSPELTRGEDLDMWCRIGLNYNVVFLNKVCATYFQNAENRSVARKGILAESFANNAEEILRKEQNAGNNSLYFEEYMIKIIISKAIYMINKNKHKNARKVLYKYRRTKYNKRRWIKTYLLSFRLIDFLNNIKKQLK